MPKKQANKSKKMNNKDKMNKAINNPKITMKMRTREKMRVARIRLMNNERMMVLFTNSSK